MMLAEKRCCFCPVNCDIRSSKVTCGQAKAVSVQYQAAACLLSGWLFDALNSED